MDKAEGVPLFIEEVTKALLDLGVLQRENGAYRLVKSLSEVSVPIPSRGSLWPVWTASGTTANVPCSWPR